MPTVIPSTGASVFDQDLVLQIVDGDGDLALVEVTAHAKGTTNAQHTEWDVPFPDVKEMARSVYNNDELLLYSIALAQLLFFEDALKGWGDQATDIHAGVESSGGSWSEGSVGFA